MIAPQKIGRDSMRIGIRRRAVQRAWGGLVLAAATAAMTAAWGQALTPPQLEQIQRQQDRILQEEQLRRQEQLRQQDPARRPPGNIGPDLAPTGPDALPSGPCSQVNAIRLEGAERLTREEQEQLTAPYVGRCVGLQEIGELMRAITNRYIELGLVTTRVYIPQQDLGTGTLRLLVLEGKVGELRLQDPDSRVSLATAFPGVRGRVLNIRDIEQGLDQINRLRSNSASMELQPSAQPGVTDIVIANQQGMWLSGNITVDDYGSPATGDVRATASFAADNVLGLNDAWFVSLSRNTDAHPGSRLSESSLVSFNLPYGYWNFFASAANSRYNTIVSSLTQQFLSTGETDTYSVGVQRVLARGQTSKLTLNVGLTHKDSRNYIEGSLLTTSSPKLTDVQVGLTSVFFAGGGFWTVDGGVSRGVNWFGVEPLPGAGTGTVPTPEYLRLQAAASFSRPFRIADVEGNWSTSVQGQTSRDYLYGSEQISIGGLYTVRGFDGTSIAGDRGLYWRNEFSTLLPASDDPRAARIFGRLQPYIGLDVGHVFGREGQPGGTLAGAVLGVRALAGQVSFDFGYGVPLHVTDWLKHRGNVENHSLYGRVSVSF